MLGFVANFRGRRAAAFRVACGSVTLFVSVRVHLSELLCLQGLYSQWLTLACKEFVLSALNRSQIPKKTLDVFLYYKKELQRDGSLSSC